MSSANFNRGTKALPFIVELDRSMLGGPEPGCSCNGTDGTDEARRAAVAQAERETARRGTHLFRHQPHMWPTCTA